MGTVIRINDQASTAEDFVSHMKLTGRFESELEIFLNDKLQALAAKKMGIKVSDAEIQERADQIRRIAGLHRAIDTNRWLERLGITLNEFQAYVEEMLLIDKAKEEVLSEKAVNAYFNLNSPKFDAISLRHILVESANTAKELAAVLDDEPERFEELAREHSVADTKDEGGYIGRITRGLLVNEVEAKVVGAEVDQVIGPIAGTGDDDTYELFMVTQKQVPSLTDTTINEVMEIMKKEWLTKLANESNIDVS